MNIKQLLDTDEFIDKLHEIISGVPIMDLVENPQFHDSSLFDIVFHGQEQDAGSKLFEDILVGDSSLQIIKSFGCVMMTLG